LFHAGNWPRALIRCAAFFILNADRVGITRSKLVMTDIKQQAGYPTLQPTSNPPIKIDGYNSQAAPVAPPAAAIFDKGVTDEKGAQEACDKRRAHSAALSDPSRKGFEKQSPNS
jgi:hypothetical protein